jgi:hypothetical protein
MFGAMLFLICAAVPSLECQTPPSTDPAPSQAAPVEGGRQQPSPAQRPLADDLLREAKQVDEIVDKNLIDEKGQDFKTALAEIQLDVQSLQKSLPTQPPVKVRGGAMTVRTTRITVGGDHGNDCVVLQDPSKHPLELQFIEDPTVQGWTPVTKDLTGVKTIDLYGRDSQGNVGPDGVRLAFAKSCIESGRTYFGVTIKPIIDGHKSFYDFRDAAKGVKDEDGLTHIKRFQHPDCSQHLPDPNKDEDTCEQMSDIKIDGALFAHCTNGECFVQIVQQ